MHTSTTPDVVLKQYHSTLTGETDLYQWILSGRGFQPHHGDWLRRAESWSERCTFAATRFGHCVCSARRDLLRLANGAAGLSVPRHPSGQYTTFDDLHGIRDQLTLLRKVSAQATTTDTRGLAFGPWLELEPVRNVPYTHSGWLLTAPVAAHSITCPITWVREAWSALSRVAPLPAAPLGATWDQLNIELLSEAYDAATNHLVKVWNPNPS